MISNSNNGGNTGTDTSIDTNNANNSGASGAIRRGSDTNVCRPGMVATVMDKIEGKGDKTTIVDTVDTVDSVDIVAAGSTGSEETVIEPTTDTITPTTDTVTVPTNPTDTTTDDVLFTQKELIALRFLFSLFDRTDTGYISYDDFIVYAEDCCDPSYIRYIPTCIDIIDIDTDGVIGFLDFIYFAERLKYLYIHNVEVSF